MSHILNDIIQVKRQEVNVLKQRFNYSDFESGRYFYHECKSISKAIQASDFGIIAEIKRRSPSAGDIRPNMDIATIAKEYQSLGASAISCLTDFNFFGGSIDDLLTVKANASIPVLRKEFIIDEIQLFEAKANGADAILLIAEVLTKEEALNLTIIAQSLGMEVIMEFHDRNQLSKINELVNIIGVNNRNLALQQTSVQNSFDVIEFLPPETVLISESGISTKAELDQLKAVGYSGALIGESILKQTDIRSFFHQIA